MPLDKKDIESSLIKKGFKKKEGKKHIKFFYCDEDGVKTRVTTLLSRSSYKEINDKWVGDMARQCRLSKDDFIDFVECALSHEDYDQHLRSTDVLG